MFSKETKYRAPYFTKNHTIQVVGPGPLYLLYGCHKKLAMCGVLGCVSNQKDIIQGHPGQTLILLEYFYGGQ